MRKILISLGLLLASSVALASSLVDKEAMKRDLQFIAGVYRTGYAPTFWKEKHIGWNLEAEVEKAYAKIDGKADMKVQDYQVILKDFFRSTQDYHVGFSFYNTERASLPFQIKSAEGRYFIVFIDRQKLSEVAFPFQVGDEVVEMDGQPVEDVVKALVADSGTGVETTDRGIAELYLTRRAAARAMKVPRGTVEFKIKRQKQQTLTPIQLIWEYTPEVITFDSPESTRMHQAATGGAQKNLFARIRETDMSLPYWDKTEVPVNNFNIGGKSSYVPELGKVLWTNSEAAFFKAYIYENEAGKKIGYVRIAHYGSDGGEFQEFKALMKKYQAETDALVIDEINNPGGSLFYIYALASVLSDQMTYTPKEQIRIYPEHIREAAQTIRDLQKVQNDEQAKQVLGNDWGGYPVTYQTAQYLIEFSRFLMDQWRSGKNLTDEHYLWGVDKVNPDSEVNYTKPILVLVNELDFSGGDFFPAILQDNKRATIMGVRTSGAGGFVLQNQYPSSFGLELFSFTGSIAKRIDGSPIENLGVTPDIPYQLTVKDMQEGFQDYKNAINTAVTGLMK